MSVEAADLRSHYLGQSVKPRNAADPGTVIAMEELQKYRDRKSIRDQISHEKDPLVQNKQLKIPSVERKVENIDLVQQEMKQTYSYSAMANKYVDIKKRERSPNESVSVEVKATIQKERSPIVRQTQ